MLAEYLEKQPVLILDGGLATELERRGARLDHPLWSAKMLIEDPGLIRRTHYDYFAAGADVATTASYQASLPGFKRFGMNAQQAIDLLKKSVSLACQARDEFWADGRMRGRLRPLVAASIGPYGASLADGSEYRGDYGLGKRALMDFHRPRMALLAESGADLLAFETIPSLLEAEALLESLEEFPEARAWLSFSCRDERHVSHGEPFAECAALADASAQIAAVGVNCTHPAFVPALLESASTVSKPLLAYPNSGETWDRECRGWVGSRGGGLDAAAWVRAGAMLVGGCCRVGPEDIRAIRTSVLGS